MLQFSEKLLNNLMQIGLTVSLAALVPLILRRLMKKRYPARMVCVVWAILALRLLIPVQLTLPQAGSPYPGGVFSAEPQRGIRRRCGGNVAAPAAGAKRKDNLRFSFLFELLPFPCFLIWRRLPICDRFEKEYGRGFFLPYLSQPIRSVR